MDYTPDGTTIHSPDPPQYLHIVVVKISNCSLQFSTASISRPFPMISGGYSLESLLTTL